MFCDLVGSTALSARFDLAPGAVEVAEIVTRDEQVERHPARHGKIDKARMKFSGGLSPRITMRNRAPELNGKAPFASFASSFLPRRKSALGHTSRFTVVVVNGAFLRR
jgi:hypothetical protein